MDRIASNPWLFSGLCPRLFYPDLSSLDEASDAALQDSENTHMKAVILAGGLGTRISEESHLKPKPMIEIGGKPILWHIMKIYSHFGINEFVICCGYRGYVIKEYFANYFLHMSDFTFDTANNTMEVHHRNVEPWRVTLVDTGHTLTGGRLKRVREHLGHETFCLTYGDGVSDIDLGSLIQFHKSHGKLATVTAIRPPGRYGTLMLNGHSVKAFRKNRRAMVHGLTGFLYWRRR
jgi:glucose-1-phosphate cytidylyltransferase